MKCRVCGSELRAIHTNLPFKISDIEDRPLRAARELYYEAGAQLGHFFQDRS